MSEHTAENDAPSPDAWRDNTNGVIYLNGRKYEDDLLYAYDADPDCTALWFGDIPPAKGDDR